MQTVSRLGSNLKAFLSPSKGKQNVSSGAGDRGMSSDNTQHGSGSSPVTSGGSISSSPEHQQPPSIANTTLDELSSLGDEEFNARIAEQQARLESMRRPSRPALSDSKFDREFNPVQADLRASFGGVTSRDDYADSMRQHDSFLGSPLWNFDRRQPPIEREELTSDKKYLSSPEPIRGDARGAGTPVDLKNLVKIETLLKEFKRKLTGPENFSSWLSAVKSVGKFRRWPSWLLDAKAPGQSMDADFDRAREEAYLVVMSTISTDLAYLIEGVEFNKIEEAMSILRDKFTAVTVLQKQAAVKDFTMMSQESTGQDVDAFAATIKLEASRLRDMGKPVSDVEMSSVFLNGLLQDFHVIKSQMSDEDGLGDFKVVVAKVSRYAKNNGLANKKVKAKRSGAEGIALAVTPNKSKGICNSYKDTGKCRFGDKCKYKHIDEKSATEKAKDDKDCFKCGKAGHWAKDCKAKKGVVAAVVEDDEGSASEKEEPKGKRYTCPVVLAASAKHSSKSFGLDSFASHHLTNDITDFIPGSLRDVKLLFTIGNGSDMEVKQQGDILFSQGESGEPVKLCDVGFNPKLPLKLMSCGRLFNAGFQIEHGNEVGIMDICKDGVKILQACVKDNVLVLDDIHIDKNVPLMILDGGADQGINSSLTNSTPNASKRSCKDSTKRLGSISLDGSFEKVLVVKEDTDLADDNNATLDEDIMALEVPEKLVMRKAIVGTNELSIEEAHVRFGHIGIKAICKLLGLPPPDKDTPKIECESCAIEKQRLQSLPDRAQSRASRPLYRVFVDSSGKKTATEGGNQYFIVVVDDYSRKGWTMLTQSKSEIPDKILVLLKQLQAQHPARKLAFLRVDGAKEYAQGQFKKAIEDMGCVFEVSAPYRQAQNGVAESRIGLVWKMAVSFLHHSASDHPRSDWGYAVKQSNLIINQIPSDANDGISPDDMWGDARSKLAIPGPLFCLCFAKRYVRSKMEPEAIKCIYMGNSEEHKAYLVRPIEGDRNDVFVSRDVTFFPSQMPYRHPTVRRPSTIPEEEPIESDEEPRSELADKIPKPPQRVQSDQATDGKPEEVADLEPQGEMIAASDIPRGFTAGSKVYVVDQHERTKQWRVYEVTVDSMRQDGVWIKFRGRSEAFGGYTPDVDVFRSRAAAEKLLAQQANCIMSKESLFVNMADDDKRKVAALLEIDPETRKQMLDHPHRDGYIGGELIEMKQILEQKVWELVKLEKDMHVLDSRWVYKAKRHLSSGEISKFRSRFVAKGFKERYGMEFWETFSSNIKLEDVRLMLALVTYYDLELWHFDIRGYFLYGVMDELVYIHQPDGYREGPARGEPGELVCKLQKAIYGTKQAQRCADKVLKQAWKDAGVLPLMSDNSMFYSRDGDKIFVCGMYVDDGLCFGNDESYVKEKLDALGKAFDLVIIKDPKVFVGIQIERDRAKGVMLLHQEGAVLKLMGSINMLDCNPAKTPMQTGIILSDPATIVMSKEIRVFPFQSLVGQLLWLLGTRMDLCFAINVLTRYMSNWDEQAIVMLKRVVRYLKGKERYGLVYMRGPKDAKIENADNEPVKMGFTADADHAAREHDSKTTGASTTDFDNNTVAFNTKVQSIGISTSTGQAEAITCKLTCHGVEWTSGLLTELKIRGHGPIVLKQDNKSVISLSVNPINHKRSKHYRVAMAYVRDLVERRIVILEYEESAEIIADVLTKALGEAQFWKLLKKARFGKLDWFVT